MRVGGGATGGDASTWVSDGFTLETWKVGWIRRIVEGSLRRMAVGLIMWVMVKGPTYRGASLHVPPLMGISLRATCADNPVGGSRPPVGLPGDKLSPIWTSAGGCLGTRSFPDLPLDVHPNHVQEHLRVQDGLRRLDPVIRLK